MEKRKKKKRKKQYDISQIDFSTLLCIEFYFLDELLYRPIQIKKVLFHKLPLKFMIIKKRTKKK